MSMAALPDVESLRLLVLVARRGSLTAAAAELGLTQPAASKRMSALERRLAVRLLDRSRRGSALTPAGTLVQERAQRVLDGLTDQVDGVERLRRVDHAQLRVAASLTVADHLLPDWLGGLHACSPGLRLGLQVLNSSRVCELVRDQEIDLGFVESPGGPRGLGSRRIVGDRLVLVVTPDHRWAARRRPVEAAELAATALVSREVGSGTRDTADRAFRACGLRASAPLLELGSGAAVCNAVAAGAGPALVSELTAADPVAAGKLVEVATAGLRLHRLLRAVWRSGTTPTGGAAQLLSIALARPSLRARRAGCPPAP